MNCPSTLTLSACADNALPEAEAAAVRTHLDGCERCRATVENLAGESAALRSAMLAAEAGGVIPAFVPRPTIPRMLAWLLWGALGVWAMNVAWLGLTSGTELPGWLSWVAPDATGVGIEFFVGLLSFLIREGADLVAGLIESARWLALGAGGILAGWLLLRRRGEDATMLCLQVCLCAGVILTAGQGHAFEVRHDESRVTVAADEVIDDTLIVVSEDIRIEGTVTGDLVVFGETVTITGEVGGMLITGAEKLDVESRVGGSAVIMGESVDIRSASFGRDLYSAGETVIVHPDTEVQGNAALAGEEVELHGSVGRDLLTAAEKVSVLGSVARNARAYAERVALESDASIGGDLTVRVQADDKLTVADGARIGGTTDLSNWPEQPNRYLTADYYVGQVLKLLAAFITGLVIFYLFPALRRTSLADGREVAATLGYGVLVLIVTPIAAGIVTITLIGAPVGIITFLLWFISLYVASIIVAAHVGRLLVDPETHHPALPLIVGLLIYYVLVSIPLLGGLVSLAALLIGLGLLVEWVRSSWRAA